MSYLATILLALVSAGFYISATVALKYWHAMPPVMGVLAITCSLGLAALFEIELLREARLGEVVILVIAFEVVIGVALSLYFFGDAFSAREGIGLTVVVIGLGILTWHPADRAAPSVGRKTAGLGAVQNPLILTSELRRLKSGTPGIMRD